MKVSDLTRGKYIVVMLAMVIIAGCTTTHHQTGTMNVPEIHPGILAGYLQSEEYPNSLELIPAPPAKGSAALALDEEIHRKSIELRGTPRWDIAAKDAVLSFPEAAETFSCVLNIPVTEKDTPHLYILLRRTLADAGLSTYTAKNKYQRKRPFMQNDEPICTPEEESSLRTDGSYPSGHTAIGWAWALILTEIAPDRAGAILARGRAFGESRNICNVHWRSDVIEGRFVGAAAVARLHTNPAFLAEVEAAKAEVNDVRARGLKPTGDCQAEADVLGNHL